MQRLILPKKMKEILTKKGFVVETNDIYIVIKPKSVTHLTKGIVSPPREDVTKLIKEEYPLWLTKNL